MSLPFRDRHDAGRQLADRLHCYTGTDTIVLGLPRGGIPVGYEIAHALHSPLDVFLLRWLCVPGDGEAVIGAVASGGVRVLRPSVIDDCGLTPAAVDELTRTAQLALIARERTFRGQQRLPELGGRVVVLADDGGTATDLLLSAIAALREHGPRAIVLATPSIPAACEARLRMAADDLVYIVARPDDVHIERWYMERLPVSHTEVRALLSLAVAEAQSRELAELARI